MMLWVYVVYHNTEDFPGKFVVRKQAPHAGTIVWEKIPTAVTDTLEEARAAVPPGFVCHQRDPKDDPVIVESWLRP